PHPVLFSSPRVRLLRSMLPASERSPVRPGGPALSNEERLPTRATEPILAGDPPCCSPVAHPCLPPWPRVPEKHSVAQARFTRNHECVSAGRRDDRILTGKDGLRRTVSDSHYPNVSRPDRPDR